MSRFLFLQGPHGPFFARLADVLRATGHKVYRINLCGGDRRDWTGDAVDYRHTASRWPEFFGTYLLRNGITDVVLYGDCRPMHVAAHAVAKAQGVAIWVFEEGYIRPDWMTLERDGVNGYSKLSTDPAVYLAAARDLPLFPNYPPIQSNRRRRLKHSSRYILDTYLSAWRFPHYRSHRPIAGWLEAAGWCWRLSRRKQTRRRAARAIESLSGKRYALFPLQLNSDYQIRLHSPFADMSDAIEQVVASLAQHADPALKLVVKLHPLDNGLIAWRRIVDRLSLQHGVADRVVFLDGGNIDALVARACSLVSVNSTTGTLALASGVPTIALGSAVYDVPGITHQGSLDKFWTAPTPPDPLVWDAFSRVLRDRCLIHGSMFDDRGLDELVAGASKRLTAPPVPSAEA